MASNYPVIDYSGDGLIVRTTFSVPAFVTARVLNTGRSVVSGMGRSGLLGLRAKTNHDPLS